MKTIYHAMITFIAARGKIEPRDLAAVCYPDAIRAYTSRHISHFEEGRYGGLSWMEYPLAMDQAYLPTEDKYHDAGTFNFPGALGGKTSIKEFKSHNEELPVYMYRNIMIHLIQDEMYDSFVRQAFDERRKNEDIYYSKWDDRYINSEELRKKINRFEDLLYPVIQDAADRILHRKLRFDDFKDLLEKAFKVYPEDLRERTLSYMTMDNEIKKKTDDLKYKTDDLVFCYRYQAVAMINKMLQGTRKILKF